MKKKCLLWTILGVISVSLSAQPLAQQEKYDLTKDKVLYLIGYAHLDTEWLWDYPSTINQNIKNTMEENFYLFKKYPDYVFNFTGSRRYGMMKEYYPDLYKKVVQYVKDGRWHISGSSVDEGEVNISSSESLVRQVLYGNEYFRKEFGTASMDYMLPDCFGFLANVPSIWNHCGLLGFSTQKLTWHAAVPIPFNVGVWNGPDGKGIVAALNVSGYTSPVSVRMDRDSVWNARLDQNIRNGYSFDYAYYGVGDQGGAPRENDVRHAVGSLRQSDSRFKVVLASSDQMYKDITPEIRKKLPVYAGDLLLTEHSAGSLTSEIYMKRLNRKNEILAQSAEQLATVADWLAGGGYPFEKLNNAWNLVLGSQFHDILPGTAIPQAYEYAWNDEFIAANGFAAVLQHSSDVVVSQLNTQVENRAVVVYNPVATDREDVVTIELEYDRLPQNVQVYDPEGKPVLTQIVGRNGNKLKVIFLAGVPSVGMSVFDVRESVAGSKSTLRVDNRSMENSFYRVEIADNGDIRSIYDKRLKKELLAKPAHLEFLSEHPKEYPAWNMDWNDRKMPAAGNMDKNASIRIVENGPVRVAIEVKREGMNSEITQTYSLSAGNAGQRLEVDNKLDWQSKGVSLKAAFPLSVSNQHATYNLGVGTIERTNNNEKKYEVPSKEWFDLTDRSGKYGVSILEDCRYGSDKPDDNTLRLTLLYTPVADAFRNAFIFQSTQDWGIHSFRYGIYGHEGDWRKGQSQWQGMFFNQPMLAFEAGKHEGSFGKRISLLKTSSPAVGIMALKKMEHGDYYLVRANELTGKDQKGLRISFPGKIADAYEVNGQEQRLGTANFSGNALDFDLSHYTIRSFAVKFTAPSQPEGKPDQQTVSLPYNLDVFSFDHNRADGRFDRDISFPAELVPSEIVSEDIRFHMGDTQDERNNAVACNGQTITLPQGGYDKLYLLADANDDTQDSIRLDNRYYPVTIQRGTGYVGQFYKRNLTQDNKSVISIENPYVKKDNIAWFASHLHVGYPSRNDAYQYCYIYKYELDIPVGTRRLTLPDNRKIKIFAVTVGKSNKGSNRALQPLYDDFQSAEQIRLRTGH
jgi:alpha-mannosidase